MKTLYETLRGIYREEDGRLISKNETARTNQLSNWQVWAGFILTISKISVAEGAPIEGIRSCFSASVSFKIRINVVLLTGSLHLGSPIPQRHGDPDWLFAIKRIMRPHRLRYRRERRGSDWTWSGYPLRSA